MIERIGIRCFIHLIPEYELYILLGLLHTLRKQSVGINLIKKLLPIIRIVIVGIVTILMIGFTSCTSVVLENDLETIGLINKVFPEAGYYNYDGEKEIYTVYNTSKSQIGYVFYAEGMSYPGTGFFSKPSALMTILVGLEDKETIKNIYVVSQGETSDFWDLLIEDSYFNQFIDLKIKEAELKQNGGEVDVITGATLSSKSVLDIVRKVTLEKLNMLGN